MRSGYKILLYLKYLNYEHSSTSTGQGRGKGGTRMGHGCPLKAWGKYRASTGSALASTRQARGNHWASTWQACSKHRISQIPRLYEHLKNWVLWMQNVWSMKKARAITGQAKGHHGVLHGIHGIFCSYIVLYSTWWFFMVLFTLLILLYQFRIILGD